TNVAVGGQVVPETGTVVVADQSDAVPGPPAGDGAQGAADGAAFVTAFVIAIEVASAALIAFPQEQREHGPLGVGRPLPQLRPAAQAPGTDVLPLVQVY